MQICRTDCYPRNRFRTLAKRRQPLLPESREMERRGKETLSVTSSTPAANMVCNRASISVSDGTPCWASITSRPKEKERSPATARHGTSACARKMVTELCTAYGDLYMIWFDGGPMIPCRWPRRGTDCQQVSSQTAFLS